MMDNELQKEVEIWESIAVRQEQDLYETRLKLKELRWKLIETHIKQETE